MTSLIDWLLSLTPHGTPFFYIYAWLINSAIYSSVTALFIILFKLIFKNKIKARWHFLIWAILLIRLTVPVLPSTPLSVFNAVKVEENVIEQSSYQTIVTPPNTKADDPDDEHYSVSQAPHSESNGFVSFTAGTEPGESVTIINIDRIILCIWLGGTIILLGYFITVLAIYKHRLKKKRRECDLLPLLDKCKAQLYIKRDVKLYYADTTPMLTGLFKPAIYVPEKANETELEATLLHELCHMKHLDVLWSAIAALVLCLNWYNPIIWLSFFMFKRDIELYCDERTLKYIDDKQGYAMLLLNTAGKKKYVLGTSSLQSGKSDVKRRIRYLAKFKKPKVFIIVLAVVLAAALAVICLTNAMGNTPKSEDLQKSRYEVTGNTISKYNGDDEVWSTEFIRDSYPTPDSYWETQTKGNDKIRVMYGQLFLTDYTVDENDIRRVGFISAVDAENGSVLFSKEFKESADNKAKSNESESRQSFVSAATIRKDGNIDAFLVYQTYQEGFEPGYETNLITLDLNGNTLNQDVFQTGEMRYFSDVCVTDDGYAVCGNDRKHNPDFVIAKAANNNVSSQIPINMHESTSAEENITWNFNNPKIWSINGKVYMTTTKENMYILNKYVAYETDKPESYYSNFLQDEKDGNFAALYTVDFENSKAVSYDIKASLSGNDLFSDKNGNICYRVIKITAEDTSYSPEYSDGSEEIAEYWMYIFDHDGNPVDNYSTGIPAKTNLYSEVLF